MVTQDTAKKETVVERVISIVDNLATETVKIRTRQLSTVEKLRGGYEKRQKELTESKSKEIAELLSNDVSETGKAMKDLLLLIKEKGKFETHETFSHIGLLELQKAKLIDVYVNPTSLYADVDTYETDPTCFILTPMGRKVCDKLAINVVLRKDTSEENLAF